MTDCYEVDDWETMMLDDDRMVRGLADILLLLTLFRVCTINLWEVDPLLPCGPLRPPPTSPPPQIAASGDYAPSSSSSASSMARSHEKTESKAPGIPLFPSFLSNARGRADLSLASLAPQTARSLSPFSCAQEYYEYIRSELDMTKVK